MKISDKCFASPSQPEIASENDYYPFGMVMPGRSFNASSYRFGFNDKEKDDEIRGQGNSNNFGDRIEDPRIGRFLSIDRYSQETPQQTPYSFAGNTPINSIDYNGLFQIVVTAAAQKAGVTIQNISNFERVVANISNIVKDNPVVLSEMAKQTGYSREQILKWMEYRPGTPKITIDVNVDPSPAKAGARSDEKRGILFEAGLVKSIGEISPDDPLYESTLFATSMLILHEETHREDRKKNNGEISGFSENIMGKQNSLSKYLDRGTDVCYKIIGLDLATDGELGRPQDRFSRQDLGTIKDKLNPNEWGGFYRNRYNISIESFKKNQVEKSQVTFKKQ